MQKVPWLLKYGIGPVFLLIMWGCRGHSHENVWVHKDTAHAKRTGPTSYDVVSKSGGTVFSLQSGEYAKGGKRIVGHPEKSPCCKKDWMVVNLANDRGKCTVKTHEGGANTREGSSNNRPYSRTYIYEVVKNPALVAK